MSKVEQTSNVPKLLVIVGETASGKSSLALQLAQRFNGEIICADSWTVRKEVNIGTAKPSLSEQHLVPHHLVDIVEPDEDFTAAVFKHRAEDAIIDIFRRGKLPIMVGGTGLYIDGVLYNYGFLKQGDRQARRVLNNWSTNQLLEYVKNAGIDLGSIDINNKRRLIRLIETDGAQPSKSDLRPNSISIGLKYERDALNQKIVSRVDSMIKNGLEDEVYSLSKRYGWDCEALKGIGYSQWQGYFIGQQTIEETRQQIIKATLELAKRQRTWFKRNKSIHWFSTPINMNEVVAYITTNLDN
jgi:tRNA dimethylallyltransferase